jgi:hypothetical protein
MPGAANGEKCQTCYGEGEVPTDDGPVACPDCGGAGTLPHPDTLIEWRLREIEVVHTAPGSEMANDLRWLAFELRRARAALTELLAMVDELDDSPMSTRMRFVASRALSLYDVTDEGAEPTK